MHTPLRPPRIEPGADCQQHPSHAQNEVRLAQGFRRCHGPAQHSDSLGKHHFIKHDHRRSCLPSRQRHEPMLQGHSFGAGIYHLRKPTLMTDPVTPKPLHWNQCRPGTGTHLGHGRFTKNHNRFLFPQPVPLERRKKETKQVLARGTNTSARAEAKIASPASSRPPDWMWLAAQSKKRSLQGPTGYQGSR